MQSLDTCANAYIFFSNATVATLSARPLFPLHILYTVHVSLSYFRRTRGNTVVRDHVVRDGSIGEEMGVVPDHAFRRPRLRLLHVRSRR